MIQKEEPIQKRAEQFERQIISHLKKLGFRDVNGGANFRIGGIQVDACGGHEDTLLVIECQITGRKTKKSIREKLKRFRGEMPILSKAFHKDETYRKYSKLKYVLTTKNIELSEEDIRFAKEKPQVHLWQEQFMDHYISLFDVIGTFARYNLLAEMGIEPRVQSTIQVPALRTRLGNDTLYSFFIEPQKLLQSAYVARREIGSENYYQRILKKDRIIKIRKFLRKGGLFPNNIIVSFNSAPSFKPFTEVTAQWPEWPEWLQFGVLTFPSSYRSCWIIDGQHRLYAFSGIPNGSKVAVAAFEKLKPEKQAQFFIEINKEQKPVEPDLLWDLEGEMRPNSKEGTISNIVKALNGIDPLRDRIYVPFKGRRKRGQLRFSGLCISIDNRKLVEQHSETTLGAKKNPLCDSDAQRTVDKVSKALSTFFQQTDQLLSEEEKTEFAFTNSGIGVMIALFERILSHVGSAPSANDVGKYVRALHQVLETEQHSKTDWKSIRLQCNSEGGKTIILQSLILGIRDVTGDKSFGGYIHFEDLEDRVKQFERKLASFMFGVLKIQSIEDFSQRAPADICARVKERKASDIAKGIQDGDISEYITLGECSGVIQRADNWEVLAPIFLEGKSGFSSKVQLNAAMQVILDFRNAAIHGRAPLNKYRYKELTELYVDILQKCID